MKILYITPWGPAINSGGGRHCYANLKSLCSYPEIKIDYIGPKFDNSLQGISPESFGNVVARDYSIYDKIVAAFNKSSTSLISLCKEFFKYYSRKVYDLVFIESTRCGFIFEELKKQHALICNVHNVEADYLRFNGSGSTYLASKNIFLSERNTLNSCDAFLVMHKTDLQRLKELYKIQFNESCIIQHPVCSFTPKMQILPYEQRDKSIAFVGSLDSHFNEMGLREFIVKCWPDLKESGYKLIVAGKNPSAKLLSFLSNQLNIEVFINPINMEKILRNTRMLILPDLTGTGMKLRVAEALSLGVPVVGTEKGMRGYQKIEKFGFAVNDVSDMSRVINELIKNENELKIISMNALNIWRTHYSYHAFCTRIHSILDEAKRGRWNVKKK